MTHRRKKPIAVMRFAVEDDSNTEAKDGKQVYRYA